MHWDGPGLECSGLVDINVNNWQNDEDVLVLYIAENNTDGSGGGRLRRTSRNLLSYHSTARPGSFQARDNISQFIGWCRSTLSVPDTLLFETEDLVSRRNERNVLLCLLEVLVRF